MHVSTRWNTEVIRGRGGSGIGEAIVRLFASQCAPIIVAHLAGDTSERVAGELARRSVGTLMAPVLASVLASSVPGGDLTGTAAMLLGLLFVVIFLHTDLTGRDLEVELELWALAAGVLDNGLPR